MTATLAAAIAYVGASHGLVLAWPTLLTGLLVGGTAALCNGDPVVSGVATGATALLLGLVMPPWHATAAGGGAFVETALVALTAGVTAAAVTWVRARTGLSWARAATGIAVLALILGALWSTSTMMVTAKPDPGALSLREKLLDDPTRRTYTTDTEVFRATYFRMARGEGYYSAYRASMLADADRRPGPMNGALMVREPAVFELWHALGSPARIPIAFLVLASLAACAAFSIGDTLGEGRFGGLSALLVATYLAFFSLTEAVLLTEAWAAMVGMVAAALFVRGAVTKREGWLWAASAAALLSALVREHMVLLLVAMSVAALTAREDPRPAPAWRRSAPWLASVVAFIAAYAVHWRMVGGPLLQASSDQYSKGGLEHLLAAVSYAGDLMQPSLAALFVLVPMGLFGASLLRSRPSRWMLLGFVGAMLVVFLLGGSAAYDSKGARIGYWGPLAVPFALVTVPFVAGVPLVRATGKGSGP